MTSFQVQGLLLVFICFSPHFAHGQRLRQRHLANATLQYTPEAADWNSFYTKTLAVRRVDNHTPDGIRWLSENDWKPWDGHVIDPREYTRWELYDKVCPSGNTILGLKELYYQHNPFSDVYRPTKAEVDEWHRLVVNHIRKLFGYYSSERAAKPDVCMHAIAFWSQERAHTDKWDSLYPEKTCRGSKNQHCGDTFRLRLEHQGPYLPAGHAGCPETTQGYPGYPSGVTGAVKSDIPWSINIARGFCSYLEREGFWGGHVGPFLLREYFGFSFWDFKPHYRRSAGAELRGRWTGALHDHLYARP